MVGYCYVCESIEHAAKLAKELDCRVKMGKNGSIWYVVVEG